jgi:hypothetical protein
MGVVIVLYLVSEKEGNYIMELPEDGEVPYAEYETHFP